MRLRRMVAKEIKQALRDKQAMVMMMIFPLIMTLVLGFALSGMFKLSTTPSEIHALYSADNSRLGQSFTQFLPEFKKRNVILTEEKDIDKAVKAVQNAETSCFIQAEDGKITIYSREGRSFSTSLVDTMVKGFAGAYDAYKVVLSEDHSAMSRLDKIAASGTAYTRDVSLTPDRKPGAMDYYALTMLTLIVMYGALYGLSSISEEKRNKTLYRIFAAPAKNSEIPISKVVGNILAITVQTAFVFLIDKVFLNTYWGDDLFPIFAILLSQIIMVTSFGVGLGYIFKNSDAGNALIQTIIPVLVFLGGGYVNFEMLGITGFIDKLAMISPVRWINKTILQIVYANDYSGFWATIAICLAIAAAFLGVSALISGKELKA